MKRKFDRPATQLHPVPVPNYSWKQIGIDLVGPLACTEEGNKYHWLLHQVAWSSCRTEKGSLSCGKLPVWPLPPSWLPRHHHIRSGERILQSGKSSNTSSSMQNNSKPLTLHAEVYSLGILHCRYVITCWSSQVLTIESPVHITPKQMGWQKGLTRHSKMHWFRWSMRNKMTGTSTLTRSCLATGG